MTHLQLQNRTVSQQCPTALLRYRKPSFKFLSTSRAQIARCSLLSRRATCPAVRATSDRPAADGSAQHGGQKPVPARSLALLATGTSLALASAWMFSQVFAPHHCGRQLSTSICALQNAQDAKKILPCLIKQWPDVHLE